MSLKKVVESLTLHEDNKISIVLSKNIKNQHHTKLINVKYYYIRELVNERQLTIKRILESKMLNDKIAKKLFIKNFRNYQVLLGMFIK